MESIREWSVGEAGRFVARSLLLAALVYILVRAPDVGLTGLFDAAGPYWFVSVSGTVLVLGYVVVRSRWTGWKLVGALALLYVGIQTVSFVELYLYGLESAAATTSNATGSLWRAVLTVAVIVAGHGRLRGEEEPVSDERLQFGLAEWAWKLPLLAGIFLLAMIFGGLVVFEPVAQLVDPQALSTYEILDPPAWILPFQLVRGVVFTALLLPVIYLLRGGYRETQVTVATLFAWLLGSGLLIPTATIPGNLWMAHFVEVFGSMFVYALVLVPLVFRSHHPLARLASRRRRRAEAVE